MNIIHPHDSVTSLHLKWVVKALEPGQSNLHLMLRYRLSNFQPFKSAAWAPSMEFFVLPGHQAKQGSRIWNRVSTAWAKPLPDVSFIEPQCFEELLSSSFWWNPYAPAIEPEFSRDRAGQLHRMGLRFVRDAWHDREVRFLRPDEVACRHGLRPDEFGAFLSVLALIASRWPGLIAGPPPLAKLYDWIGWYQNDWDSVPSAVVEVTDGLQIPISAVPTTAWIPLTAPCFRVNSQARTLVRLTNDTREIWSQNSPDGSPGTQLSGTT